MLLFVFFIDKSKIGFLPIDLLMKVLFSGAGKLEFLCFSVQIDHQLSLFGCCTAAYKHTFNGVHDYNLYQISQMIQIADVVCYHGNYIQII